MTLKSNNSRHKDGKDGIIKPIKFQTVAQNPQRGNSNIDHTDNLKQQLGKQLQVMMKSKLSKDATDGMATVSERRGASNNIQLSPIKKKDEN